MTITPPRLSNRKRAGEGGMGRREGEGGQEERGRRRVSQLVVFIDVHGSKSEVLDSI